MAEPRTVLLSGVTGFLGRELLFELLTKTDARIVCLIRADSDHAAGRRLQGVLDKLFGPGGSRAVRGRLSTARGDVTKPMLGLDGSTRDELIATVTDVVHGAASVQFDLPLVEARRINVGGTVHALRFAAKAYREGQLQRFLYMSTAFVGGEYPKWFCEDDLDLGQRFRNTYERSKFEAEIFLHDSMRKVPVTIVRPSIVVGHSRSGATSAFNVIYWPLRVYADGMLRYAPATPDLPVDIVPVDFVARGTVEALMRGEPGETYALAAGERATRASAIGDMAARVFNTEPPVFERTALERALTPLLAPALVIGPWRRFGRAVLQYLPYFRRGSRFDTTKARALLEPSGIAPPSVDAFLEPVLEFARATDFGRDRAAIAAEERALARQRRRALEQRTPQRRQRRSSVHLKGVPATPALHRA